MKLLVMYRHHKLIARGDGKDDFSDAIMTSHSLSSSSSSSRSSSHSSDSDDTSGRSEDDASWVMSPSKNAMEMDNISDSETITLHAEPAFAIFDNLNLTVSLASQLRLEDIEQVTNEDYWAKVFSSYDKESYMVANYVLQLLKTPDCLFDFVETLLLRGFSEVVIKSVFKLLLRNSGIEEAKCDTLFQKWYPEEIDEESAEKLRCGVGLVLPNLMEAMLSKLREIWKGDRGGLKVYPASLRMLQITTADGGVKVSIGHVLSIPDESEMILVPFAGNSNCHYVMFVLYTRDKKLHTYDPLGSKESKKISEKGANSLVEALSGIKFRGGSWHVGGQLGGRNLNENLTESGIAVCLTADEMRNEFLEDCETNGVK